MKLRFLGAADAVTGSRHLVDTGTRCRIQDELGWPVRVPQHGETVEP